VAHCPSWSSYCCRCDTPAFRRSTIRTSSQHQDTETATLSAESRKFSGGAHVVKAWCVGLVEIARDRRVCELPVAQGEEQIGGWREKRRVLSVTVSRSAHPPSCNIRAASCALSWMAGMGMELHAAAAPRTRERDTMAEPRPPDAESSSKRAVHSVSARVRTPPASRLKSTRYPRSK
jgi:hypothetical protein